MVLGALGALMEGTVPDSPTDPDNHHPDTSPDGGGDDVRLVLSPRARDRMTGDRYDLAWLFLCWAWEAGYRDWDDAVRVLARALRGLERVGLVERRTVRRAGQLTHHGFVLTDAGREAVTALSGHWIEESK